MGGGQFENLIFLKLKIRKFLPGGRGSESKCPYFLLNFKWFLERFFNENHPLIFPKNVCHLKTSFLGPFWVNLSTLLRNALDFLMVSTLLLV